MVGHPKHVPKALEVGVDLICAQAGEGGGHTGDMPASILIPAVVDEVKGKKSPLTGGPVLVIGAGAVYDGRGLAANLAWGAQAVWVGTRFVACEEAGAPPMHKKAVVNAGHEDFVRTLIFTGRPLRVVRNPYIDDWYVGNPPRIGKHRWAQGADLLFVFLRENNRQAEAKALLERGVIPVEEDLKAHPENSLNARPWLTGRVAAQIHEVLPAKKIIDDMVNDAAKILKHNASLVNPKAKL